MVEYIIKPIKSSGKLFSTKHVLSNRACKVPFTHIEIHTFGQVSACCHTWLPVWVGNLLDETPDEIINNVERKRIQDNMREGNFSDCNNQCPQLNSILSGGYNYWDIVDIGNLNKELEKTPIHIGFSYDPSCNLQCPSCRTELLVWDPEDPQDENGQRIKKIHNKVKGIIEILLGQGKMVSLNITGSGDAFASPLYWNYLVELSGQELSKNLTINLKTNGVMMTLENLKKIEKLWPIIRYIEISVDAATEETYKIVRKNGNFKRLKKNLVDFDNLVSQGCFPFLRWQTNFVVQKDNFKELKEFMEWQLTFNSKPTIWTNLLAQWYHMDDETFNKMAVWKEEHPDRKVLINILQDPIFRHNQIKLGNMSGLTSI